MTIRALFFFGIISVVIFSSCATTSSSSKQSGTSEMTIAFGSCNHQDDPQPIWVNITKNNPDLWIWTGDIIYSDTEDMSKMKADYNMQSQQPEYKSFASSTDIIGIWDDHDYGVNNGGQEYPKKDSAKTLLFDFLNVPEGHPSQSREGAYQSYTYNENDLKVKVLLLDARYFRGTPNTLRSTILGGSQWQWLVSQLSANDADVHLIVSGVQVLPTEHKFEKWANFKTDRERLLNIIDQLEVNHPILISGDRHIAEMTLQSLPQSGDPILEITSSGLTHYYKDFSSETNSYRYGEVVADFNFGVLRIEKDGDDIYFSATIKDGKNKKRLRINSEDLDGSLGKIESSLLKKQPKKGK